MTQPECSPCSLGVTLAHVHTVVAAVDWVHSLATAESGQMMLQEHKSVSMLVPMRIQVKPITLL